MANGLHEAINDIQNMWRVELAANLEVANALSENLTVEVVKNKVCYSQSFSEGIPLNKLKKVGEKKFKSGTKITFSPDRKIFTSDNFFDPEKVFELAKSKALHSCMDLNTGEDEYRSI